MSQSEYQRLVGMISGTSHDGVDVAVVDFALEGETLAATVVHADSTPYPTELRAELVAALPPHGTTVEDLCRLDTAVGQYFAQVAADAAAASGDVDAVCSHGQTIFHWVRSGRALGTWQLGQPAWIAERLGVPVVTDVRTRDIAAGGQGAPLVPLLDTLLLSGLAERGPAAALNLGGISNVTVVGDGEAIAYEIGPANALIDAVVQGRDLDPNGYDTQGRLAASGTVHQGLLDQLLTEPYYAQALPKSTGKELFHGAYLEDHLQRFGAPISDEDLIATLTRLTTVTVSVALREAGVSTVVAAGGGVQNPVLMEWISDGLPGVEITTTEVYGVPPDVKEAFAFALIGWCTLHGLPGNVATATGASGPRLLGSITPGRAPLQLPPPVSMPTSLRVRSSP